MSALNYRNRASLWRLELLAYWNQKPLPDRGGWLRFGALVAITLEIEVIVALWLSGALRPV